MTRRVIWWIRRDLRLRDNHALVAAWETAEEVIPVFVLDPGLRHAPTRRRAFLLSGLRALDEELRARGGYLVVREGPPVEILSELMRETGSTAVFAEGDVSPYARRRDTEVASRLPLVRMGWPTIHPPDALQKEDGGPYRVFGAFRRRWWSLAIPKIPPDEAIPSRWRMPAGIPTLPLPEIRAPEGFPAGERAAWARLRSFVEGEEAPIFRYRAIRRRVDGEAGARLSPYLRFGMISPRQALQAALEAESRAPDAESRRSVRMWIDELIWRDFFMALLYAFPDLRRRSLRPSWKTLSPPGDDQDLEAWRGGRTGYPLIDAAMRQLAQEGWVPNRGRMIAAFFLARHLHIDWRKGERWFLENLIDGDPAINAGNWQWATGAGLDPLSTLRSFDMIRQARQADPHGRYIRRYLPELAQVPDAFIHAPWMMPEDVQREAGCRIGWDYPRPRLKAAEGTEAQNRG